MCGRTPGRGGGRDMARNLEQQQAPPGGVSRFSGIRHFRVQGGGVDGAGKTTLLYDGRMMHMREYPGHTRARVGKVERVSDKDWRITLDGPVPAFQENDVIDNITWNPNLTARNNHVSVDPVRGFLLATRGKVIVENNTFENAGVSAAAVKGLVVIDNQSAASPLLVDVHPSCTGVTYDITGKLNTGDNVIAVWTGPGWARSDGSYGKGVWKQDSIFKCQVNLSNGLELHSDSSWKCAISSSENLSLWKGGGEGEYGGELIDARRQVPDWNKPSFDDGSSSLRELPACGGIGRRKMKQRSRRRATYPRMGGTPRQKLLKDGQSRG